jgi:hypothetical protein
MKNNAIYSKVLAVIGTILIWLPILSPFAFSIIRLITGGIFHLDYLMPAELFPIALAGAGLLLWAAWRAQSQRKIIAWGLCTAVLFLIGGQVLAVATGLASGETEAAGWPWALVIVSLAVYYLALVIIGIGGVLLLRNIYQKSIDTSQQT